MKKLTADNPLTKIYFPLAVKIPFVDFCKMSSLPYGRVMWTLARMFTEGRINKDEFIREYYKSSQSVLKNQTKNLEEGRIDGQKAHAIHKINKELTTGGDCVKLDTVNPDLTN